MADTVSVRPPLSLLDRIPGVSFWMVSLLLTASFLFGGSSRGDVQSLVILRPLAVVILGMGLARLSSTHVARYGFILAMAAAVIAIPLLHLIPLPPEWWQSLPGRDLIAAISQEIWQEAQWRPLSMAPHLTWNALFALLVPLAVLVHGIQLDARELGLLVPVVLVIGGASALLALAQVSGEADGPLYFYAITNPGAAVGFFANRNHQALLLAALVGLIACVAVSPRTGRLDPLRAGICAMCAVSLVPLILLTGSRAGLMAAGVALLAVPVVLRGARWARAGSVTRDALPSPVWLITGLGAVATVLAAISIVVGRAVAWDRLWGTDAESELRFELIPSFLVMAKAFFPFGSGAGTFEPVYQMLESDEYLSSFYMNHAHNDWLEAVQTAGLPGLFLMLLAVVAFLKVTLKAFFEAGPPSGNVLRARAGAVVVYVLALGSLGDYPLRTPALACLFVVAVLWMADFAARPAGAPKHSPAAS